MSIKSLGRGKKDLAQEIAADASIPFACCTGYCWTCAARHQRDNGVVKR